MEDELCGNSSMLITIIAAHTSNRCIGKNNQLPFRLLLDLQNFKEITMGKPIIMGRKTYESIGKPLPGRENIIISRSMCTRPDGFMLFNKLDDGLQYADKWSAKEEGKEYNIRKWEELMKRRDHDYKWDTRALTDDRAPAEIMIIGGADIYEQMIKRAHRMRITEVKIEVEDCDAFFPEYDISEWNVVKEEGYVDGGIPCIYRQLERKSWS